jgi:hypothetical protein
MAVLWVRSYFVADDFSWEYAEGRDAGWYKLASDNGQVLVICIDQWLERFSDDCTHISAVVLPDHLPLEVWHGGLIAGPAEADLRRL